MAFVTYPDAALPEAAVVFGSARVLNVTFDGVVHIVVASDFAVLGEFADHAAAVVAARALADD